MYDRNANILAFPHIILGDKLAGRTYTFNDINAGMIQIEKLNLMKNKFLGGNVQMFGVMQETGIYLCPHFEQQRRIVAFYIHDPEQLTDLGKQLIEQHYAGVDVIYHKISSTVHRNLTPEEMKRKIALLEEAKELGINVAHLNKSTVAEIEGALTAIKSGKSGTTVTPEEDAIVEIKETKVQHRRATPKSQSIRRGG